MIDFIHTNADWTVLNLEVDSTLLKCPFSLLDPILKEIC